MSFRDLINIDFFLNLNLLFKPKNAVPTFEVESLCDIQKVLDETDIEAVILDIDQTLVPFRESQISEEIRDFIRGLAVRANLCLLSNVPRRKARIERIRDIEGQLGVKAVFAGKRKPSPAAFQAAIKYLKSHPSKTLMVGDRVFTDVIGANNLGIPTVLLPPINPKTDPFFMVRIPRFFESKYLKLAKLCRNRKEK